MPRVKKDAEAMAAMCARLAKLVQYVYGGNSHELSRAMGYGSITTLRKALRDHDTFPDVERFNVLMKSPAKGGVIPNLNWLVNGVEQPLLQVRNGSVVRQLTFGTLIDEEAQSAPRRRRK